MIVCDPLPDEPFLCHALRNQLATGLDTHIQLFKQLRLQAKVATRRGPGRCAPTGETWVELLAKHCGLDPFDYAMDHTSFPLLLYGHVSALEGGRAKALARLDLQGPDSPRCDLLFCPACVEEDTQDYGFAYYRRKHQFLGSIRCSTHDVGLRSVARERMRVTTLPHVVTISGGVPQPANSNNVREISRYQTLSEYVLDGGVRIDQWAACSSLTERIRARWGHVRAEDLWDKAVDRFGEGWMLSLHQNSSAPGVGAGLTMRSFYLVTGLTAGSVQLDGLLIAALLACDDPREAFGCLVGDADQGEATVEAVEHGVQRHDEELEAA